MSTKARRKRLWQLFRITPEEYDKILAFQKGVCAISGKPAKNIRLAIDHCHTTGLIRGLLSMSVNKGLAYFNDSSTLLRAAADYIDNPPATKVLGKRYGVIGQAKLKKVMRYGPLPMGMARKK